ncbi:MAG: HepT-like ribonuclease domain-containing protein, partial [Waterburya sp.]
DFVTNLQLQDAVIRRILIIGEAARRISQETKQNLPTVPWTAINGIRNRLVHEYDDIDLDVVWDTLIKSLPILIKELENVVSLEE